MSYGNSSDFGQPAPPKNNTLWWILGILGAVTVVGGLLCCGGVYFMYRFGTQIVGDQVKLAVSADPVVNEHIGTISDVSMNFTATGEAGGGNTIVFDVTGDKGSGQIEVVMDNGNGQGQGQVMQSCVLILPNGDRHDITLSPPVDAGSPAAVSPDVSNNEQADSLDMAPITASEPGATPEPGAAEAAPANTSPTDEPAVGTESAPPAPATN